VSAPLAQAESAAGEWVVDESGNPVQWVPAPVAQDAGQSQVQPQVQQQQAQEWQAPARVQSQLQAPVESYYYSDESGMHWAAAPAPQPAESAAPVPMTAVAQAVADLASAAAVQTHEAYYDDAALASQSYGFDESGAPTSTSLVGARLGAAVAAASTLTQQVAYEGQWSRMTELRDESGSVVGYVDENRWDNPGYTTVVQRDAAWNVVSTQVVNEGVNAGVESATAPVATPAPAAASPAANPPAALSIPQPQRGVDEAWAQSRQSAMGVVGDAYGAARSEAEAAGQHMVSVTVYDESGTHEKLEFDEAGFRQAWLGRQSADSFAALGQLYGLSGEQLLAQRTDVVELALSRGSSVGLYEGEPPQGRLMTNQAALDAQDQFLYSDMNVALVQLFGQGPVVPATSSLALEQVRQFGQARYEQMARITQAQQHLQADYANALEQARSNPSPQFMRQEQIQVQVGGSQDESGNWIQQPTWQTQTRQVFSVEAFSQWYTREPSLAEQQALEQGDIHANAATISRMAFGQLYGVGREIERPVVGVYTDESGNPPPTERVVVFDVRVGDSVMTLELAGDRLVQPGMVGLDLNAPPDLHDARGVYWNPLVGWMTSEQNIDHGTDLFDLVLTVIVVAVVTWFSVGTAGPAVAGLLGATAGSLAAAVVIGAVTGALTSIATGVISGNFSWKNVLKGMVLGGIGGGLSFGVQGLAQMAGNEAAFAAFDAGASTTEALAAGTQAQNLVGGLGRVAQSGLMADLGGGDMGDGLVNGLISWGGDALGDGVNEGLRQDNFSPNAVTFGGNFTRAVVAGLGADAMGGNGLQAVLSNLTGSYANQAAQEDAQRYWQQQQQQQQQQQAQAQLDALSNQYGPDGSGAIVEPPEQTPSPAPDNAWPTATGDASGASPAAPATTNGPSYQTSDRADGSYDLSVGPSAQQVIANAAGGSSLGEGAQVVEGWGDAWGRSNRVVDASGRTVLILDENTWDVSGGVSATYRDANWGQIGRVETSADGSQRYWVTGSDGDEQEVSQGDFQARLNTHLGLQGVGVEGARGGLSGPIPQGPGQFLNQSQLPASLDLPDLTEEGLAGLGMSQLARQDSSREMQDASGNSVGLRHLTIVNPDGTLSVRIVTPDGTLVTGFDGLSAEVPQEMVDELAEYALQRAAGIPSPDDVQLVQTAGGAGTVRSQGVFTEERLVALPTQQIQGAGSNALKNAMFAIEPRYAPNGSLVFASGENLENALAVIASERGLTLDAVRTQYDMFRTLRIDANVEAMNRGTQTSAYVEGAKGEERVPPLSSTANGLILGANGQAMPNHSGHMGSLNQLRFGSLVGDTLGIDAVFGALMSPTGGIPGAGNKEVGSTLYTLGGGKDVVTTHGVAHDAAGYLRNFHGLGPGYNYIPGAPRLLSDTNPLAGQITGLTFFGRVYNPPPPAFPLLAA
jgi:hypothetical protein